MTGVREAISKPCLRGVAEKLKQKYISRRGYQKAYTYLKVDLYWKDMFDKQ